MYKKFEEFLNNSANNVDKFKIANRIINSIKSRLFSLSIDDLEHIENIVNSSVQNRRINIINKSSNLKYS